MSRSKRLRPTKLFLSHKWHSRVNSEVRTIVEVKAAPIEWATRQSWCHICGIEWWQTHARTRSEDKDQVRVWMIALEHIKVIPLNNLIHAAIILFYIGTSAKLSMVSRRGCWPNTTCYLTATLLAWGATSLWWLTSLAQFLLQDLEFSSVFGSSRS